MVRASVETVSGTGGFDARRWRILLGVILLLAAVLRIGALSKPFYIDEIVTITVADQPLARMAGVMRQIDASPALYPLLLHAWMSVSRSDAWVRLLSATLGLLAVYAVARLGRRAFGWRTGLAAGAVMAIGPAHVEYAQYVRSYSLFSLLAAVHVLLFIDWMDDRVRLTPARMGVFVAATAALLYTHYLSLLLFPAEGVVALYRLRQAPRRVAGWAAILCAGGLLFVPGVPLLLHNIDFDRIRNEQRAPPPAAWRLVPDIVGELSLGQRSLGFGSATTRRAALAAAAVLFPALAVIGIARGIRGRPDMALLMVAVSMVPLALYIGSGRKLVALRFFVPFAAGYVVLLGHGLASLGRRSAPAAWLALAGLCALPLAHFYGRFNWSYDHRAVAGAIAVEARDGDVVLVVHPYEALYYRWYLRDRMPIKGLVFTALEDQDGYVIKPPTIEFARARQRIEVAAAAHPRLWVVGHSRRSFLSSEVEQQRVLAWMDERYDRVSDLSGLTGADPIVRLYAVRTP